MNNDKSQKIINKLVAVRCIERNSNFDIQDLNLPHTVIEKYFKHVYDFFVTVNEIL